MKLFSFIKESYAELKKVNWSSRDDVVVQTVVVVFSVVIAAVALALVDFSSIQLVSKILTF